jgi:hypothetical protein
MFRVFCLLTISTLLFSSAAIAQATRPAPKPSVSKVPERSPDNDDQEVGHFPDEMRIKMAIARAEEDHKKVLDDVEKLSTLSSEVVKGYGENKKLSAEDIKKLGMIEKLAKKILNHAGGEEVDSKTEANEHMALGDAIDMLGTTVANIKKEMSAETRFVVSASVIANSNEVISLSRLIRNPKKTN